jgi:hypothetical protein
VPSSAGWRESDGQRGGARVGAPDRGRSMIPGADPRCRFDDGPAVVRVALPRGCVCRPADREQDLCHHHLRKATPLGGMTIILDYTVEQYFINGGW